MQKDFVRENGRVKILHKEHELDYSEEKYKHTVEYVEQHTDYSMEENLDRQIRLWNVSGRKNYHFLKIRDLNDKGVSTHPLA